MDAEVRKVAIQKILDEETLEQREAREKVRAKWREGERQRQRRRRAMETPEQREDRLKRNRDAMRKRRNPPV